MAYQVILESGIGQFREFESLRVHTLKILRDFSCAQIDLRKARERKLATLDGKSTSSVGLLNPTVCAIKNEGKNRGEEGTPTLCDHGLSRSWKVQV